eukprot:8019833-Karenia_brevis.AAC.1
MAYNQRALDHVVHHDPGNIGGGVGTATGQGDPSCTSPYMQPDGIFAGREDHLERVKGYLAMGW